MRPIFILLLALTSVALGAPKADSEKPLYQFKWGGPPPGKMTFFGSMQEVTVDVDLIDTEGEKSADMWQDLAKWCAYGALVLTALWYFSSKRELGGAAGISLICSLGCTIMAEIVTNAWWMAGLIIGVVGLLIIGYLLRNKSLRKWITSKYKQRKRKSELKDQQGKG
jgi:hypothetical protein